MKYINKALLLSAAFLLSACGGGGGGSDSEPSVPGSSAIVNERVSPSSATCPAGGILIDSGIDSNGNGVLDDNEIVETQEVCNGSTSLVSIIDEPAGENCEAGGLQILSGIDSNGNGVLDEGEYSSDGYVCNGDGSYDSNISPLSGTGTITGKVDISLISSAQQFSVRSNTENAIAATGVLTSTCAGDGLVNTPDIDSSEQVQPITEPIPLEFDAQGNYSVSVPACDSYGVIIIDPDTGKGHQEEDVVVSPGETTIIPEITEPELVEPGAVHFTLLSSYDNSPISNVSINFYPLSDSTVSGDNGEVDMSGFPVGNYSAVIEHDSYVSRSVSFAIESEKTTELGNITLFAEKGSMTGQVYAQGLDNQANIIVYARAVDGTIYTALSNESGRYNFNNMPVDSGYSVIAMPNDFDAIKVDNVAIESNAVTLVETLYLQRTATDKGSITGFALFGDQVGEMQHAGILVSVEGTDQESVTAKDGSYILTSLAAGNYTLNITDSNYQIASKNITVIKGASTLLPATILESKTGILKGTVVDEYSVPVANQTVLLSPSGMTTASNSDGVFTFSSIPVGDYNVEVNAVGYHSTSSALVAIQEGQTVVIDEPLVLNPILFSGFVTAQGQALAGAEVTITGGDLVANASVNTDANGKFSFSRLSAGNYKLSVEAEGQSQQTLGIILPGDQDYVLPYEIDLERTYGSISGSVSLASTTDYSGISVSVPGLDEPFITNVTGKWQVTLPTDLYSGEIIYSKEGFITQRLATQYTVAENQTVFIADAELAKVTGSVSGQVLTTDGIALSGVLVVEQQSNLQTTTNASGEFSFANLAIGNNTIEFQREGYVSQQASVLVEEGVDTALGSVALIARRFIGNVTDGEAGIDSVLVTLVGNNGTVAAQTSSDGVFTINAIATGNYQIQVSKAGYGSEQLQVVIPAVSEYELPFDIILEPVQGKVLGTASLNKRTSHTGIEVALNGTDYKTSTDSVGAWQMSLPLGNYSQGLTFSKTLYADANNNTPLVIGELGEFNVGSINLIQTHTVVKFNIATAGTCPGDINVAVQGTDNNFSGNYKVESGVFEQTLPLGAYQFTMSCSVDGWETIVETVELTEGIELVEYDDFYLRQSFVVINNGDAYTNQQQIELSIGNTDAVEMKISLQDAGSQSGWEDFKDSASFMLDATDGLQTVVVSFKDSSGLQLEDVTSTITLDTTILVNSFNASGASTLGDELTIKLDLAGETEATVTANLVGLFSDLKLLDNGAGGDTQAGDGIYERTVLITTPYEVNSKVTASIIDRASNTQQAESAQFVTLSSAPEVDNLVIKSSIADQSMNFTFTTNEPATVVIEYGESSDKLSNQKVVSNVLNENHQVTLTELNVNSLVWYKIIATDASANEGQLVGKSKLAPSAVSELAGYPGHQEVGLIWQVSSERVVVGYRLYRSEDSGQSYYPVNPEQLITESYFNDTAVNNDQAYSYYVTALDSDANESEASAIVTVIPREELAGPTVLSGGVIQTNEVWLSSRSPYQITANMKVAQDAQLVMLPGTEVVFSLSSDTDENSQRYMQVEGAIYAYGTEDSPIVISSEAIKAYFESASGVTGEITLNYVHLDNVGIDSDGDSDLAVVVQYSEINLGGKQLENGTYTNNLFYASTVANSRIIESGGSAIEQNYCDWDDEGNYGCEERWGWLEQGEVSFNVTTLSDSELTLANVEELQKVEAEYQYQVSLSATNIVNSELSYARLSGASVINNSTFNYSYIEATENTPQVVKNSFVASEIITNHSTFNYNILDEITTISPPNSYSSEEYESINFTHNYWGSVDLDDILARSNYKSGESNQLYPLISTASLYEADNDGDSIPDYIDSDNDNDGYSDLQEDKLSVFDSEFGSTQIYNPLDVNSHPGNDGILPDADNDGIVDSEDGDIDGDGLSNAEEEELGTDPLINDSDGDGVSDGDEIALGYDPLSQDSKPLMGNQTNVAIDSSLANEKGEVVIGAGTTLTDCTVAAGTNIVIDGSANPTFSACEFNGEFGQPITITNGSYDKENSEATLNISSSDLSYVVVKEMGQRTVELNYTSATNSEFYLEESQSRGYWYSVNFTDSYLVGDLYFYNGEIEHSKIENTSYTQYFNNETKINASFVVADRLYGYSDLVINNSVINATTAYLKSASTSILLKNIDSGNTVFENSDIYQFSSVSDENAFFFDGVAIKSGDNVIDYGYGTPEDREGDGSATTEICDDMSCITIDGVDNPRTELNFSNGVHDLWDMRNVGVGSVEPGMATSLTEAPLYMQMPMQEGNKLYQGVFDFNADGTVTYQCASAEVGGQDWTEETDCVATGYWYVSNGQITFTWIEGEGPWTSVSVAIDESGNLLINESETSESSNTPKTEDQMYDEGYDYYRLSGVVKFQDYTGHWIDTPEAVIAMVYATEGQVAMPIDVDSNAFGFEGWFKSGQFSSGSRIQVTLYSDSNGNGSYDSMEDSYGTTGDRYYGYANYESRLFGTIESPLVIRDFGVGVIANDLIDNTYYRIAEQDDGSLEMMSIYLQDASNAVYKFYHANYGDSEWIYSGDDCEGLGCIPSKEDYRGNWNIGTNSMQQTIGESIYSYAQIEGMIQFSSYENEYYQVNAVEDYATDLFAKKFPDSYVYYSDILENNTLYYNAPTVPSNRNNTAQQIARIGTVSFTEDTSINRYQPSFTSIEDEAGARFDSYGFKKIYLYDAHHYIYDRAFYQRYSSNSGWNWGSYGESSQSSYADRWYSEGVLEISYDGDTVSQRIWAIDKSNNDAWIVQYEGDYPTIWLNDQPEMDDNGVQQPDSNLAKLAVSALIDQTWVNHIEADSFQEMSFTAGGQVEIQNITWNGSEWLTVGDVETTAWTEDDNGYLSFDLNEQAQALHLLTVSDDAAALWETNTGDPQVWLAERPAWQ